MLLPLPLGPTSATVAPGGSSRSTESRARAGLAAYAKDTRSSRTVASAGLGGTIAPERAAGRSSMRSSMRFATVAPSALAWNCAARLRSGR